VGPADRLGKTFPLARHGDQMDVIRHQAISPELEIASGDVFSEYIEVGGFVMLREEGPLLPISPLDDMMRELRDHDSREPCHEIFRA
jgi:hypothetical protein